MTGGRGAPDADLRDTFGHSPAAKMFLAADVYGVAYEPRRANRAPLRVGVIGVGGVAQSKWLPALRRLQALWDPVELVGVSDPASDQGQKVSHLYGCAWYADHRELLAAGAIDAVVIASPDHLHARHAIDAVEEGVAALVEKPFCTSLVDANALCQLAADSSTIVMPVANLRFAPALRRAHEFVREHEGFRPPIALFGRMHLGYNYVDLLEAATVHLFDLARFFLGEVASVEASGVGQHEGLRPYPFRQAAITLKFASGSVAQLFTSSASLSLKPWLRVEVYGKGIWLTVDDVVELTLYDSELGPTKSWKPVFASTLAFDEEVGGYLGQLEHFLQVVRGAEPALINALDGYKAVELVTGTHLAIGRRASLALPLEPYQADMELASARERW